MSGLIQRFPSIIRGGQSIRIAAAIRQANALLSEGMQDSAIQTIDSALTENKDAPDLILMRARCLLEKFKSTKDKQYLNTARKAFSKAYTLGQRKEVLFHLWYDSEIMGNDPNGGIEVAKLALEQGVPITDEWLLKKVDAHVRLSHALKKALNWSSSVDHMLNAVREMGQVVRLSNYSERPARLELLYHIDDESWDLTTYVKTGIPGLAENFNLATACIKSGDYRPISFDRLLSTLEQIQDKLAESEHISQARRLMLTKMLQQTDELLIRLDSSSQRPRDSSTLRARVKKLAKAVDLLPY